jgi:hypothetical protein
MLVQDVCMLDMRATVLQRAYMDEYFKKIQTLPEDPSLFIRVPRRREECFCDETTCTIDIPNFLIQFDRYLAKNDIQRASNCVAYWKRCIENNDQNLIQSHPAALEYRSYLIECLRKMRWVTEKDTIEWRRSQDTGPISLAPTETDDA